MLIGGNQKLKKEYKMKIIIWLKVLILFLVVNYTTISRPLDIQFYLDKQSFLYGEPIVGILLLKNNGNDINIPQFGFMYEFSGLGVKLFSENNESVKKNIDMNLHYDLTKQQLLKNGESICDFLDISFVFGMTDDKLSSSEISYKCRALPLGNYKLLMLDCCFL